VWDEKLQFFLLGPRTEERKSCVNHKAERLWSVKEDNGLGEEETMHSGRKRKGNEETMMDEAKVHFLKDLQEPTKAQAETFGESEIIYFSCSLPVRAHSTQ